MTRFLPALAGSAAAAALAVTALTVPTGGGAAAAPAPAAKAKKVFGLTADGELVSARLDAPRSILSSETIDGLEPEESLVGIDVRPATGDLYGLGDAGGLYTIKRSTGEATLVNELTVGLSGTSFDIDFNPAVDRLRIVSDNGQNLRHDPNAGGTGTLTDTALTTPPAVTPTAGIVAAAYTNNDSSTATGTLLFDLSATGDNLLTQTPANNGTLTAIGGTGADIETDAGFDILSTRDDTGRTVLNTGYVVTGDRLHGIDLSTGLVTRIGAFGADADVVDIAVQQGSSPLPG